MFSHVRRVPREQRTGIQPLIVSESASPFPNCNSMSSRGKQNEEGGGKKIDKFKIPT